MLEKTGQRIRSIARYIIKNNTTVRDAAVEFGISKSTVHRYVTIDLLRLDKKLYDEVRRVLDYNTSQRSIRGGITTKQKFENKK